MSKDKLVLVKEQIEVMLEAMKKINEVWLDLNEQDFRDIEFSELIIDKYPFEADFNELVMDVKTWKEQLEYNIKTQF